MALALLALFWWKKPDLDLKWRLVLFAAIAVLPTAAAGTSTVQGVERTTQRDFCGSCHVMEAHYNDAIEPESQSLAARHTRNQLFGEQSCYKCHANYGMNGYVLTKMGGLGHVYYYYLGGYGSLTLEDAVGRIRIKEPYKNENCLHCHAADGNVWRSTPEHLAIEEAARDGVISCSSAGCHGAAHPFSKIAQKAWTEAHPGQEPHDL